MSAPHCTEQFLATTRMTINDKVLSQVESEKAFWLSDPFERPGVDTLENFHNKAQDSAIFFDLVRGLSTDLPTQSTIVELGGGQGWASCVIKRLNPTAYVVLTDAVDGAIQSRVIWERVFDCTLDGAVATPVQQLPFEDRSVDLLFCYAAAHHFVDHVGALQETKRVMATTGKCLWLYEPSAPQWLQAAAERRVNRKRPDVPEHVLVPKQIASIARSIDLNCTIEYCTSIVHRGRIATLYYILLDYVPILQRLLPCTVHFTFTHR